MQHTLGSVPVSSDRLPRQPVQALDHLPGPRGHWLLGNLRQLTPNPGPYLTSLQRRLGDCFTVGFWRNQRGVVLAGPEANQRILSDPDDNFSHRWGWEALQPFFGRNLLVRDFDDHRVHRKLMTPLFKAPALARYLTQMHPIIERAVEGYVGPVDVYTHTKRLALDIAIHVFAGVADDRDSSPWNRDLSRVLSNVMAHRVPLPGTRYWQALRARDRLRRRLMQTLAERRNAPGEDLFSALATQRDDQGRSLSDRDVVDHMFGLLFAAHDTTASSLAMMFWLLAKHPQWQVRAQAECQRVCSETGSTRLPYDRLADLPVVEAVFKEALRLYAPIQFLPRRSVRAFDFAGHRVPANAWILLAPQVTHFDLDVYPNPHRFDPARFLDTSPPPFAFVPFGKGSHMCLGMHFAYAEIKAVVYRTLLTRTLTASEPGDLNLEYLPIVRPKQTMSVTFEPLGTTPLRRDAG